MSRNSSRQSFASGAGTSSPASSPGGQLAGSNSPPPPIVKYQSRFKNSSQPVDERILYNIILNKLNKFSPKTYDEIRDFLYQVLGSGEPDLQEMIRDFMRLVFRKAAVEEVFCPLYAKLLCEISSRYTVILQEMQLLQANYLSIFDDIAEETDADYATFVEGHQGRQYRRGYSQFLAELTALEILSVDLLNTTFERILTNMKAMSEDEGKRTLLEEYSDCLFRMAKVLRKKSSAFFVGARKALSQRNLVRLSQLLDSAAVAKGITAKSKFILMDVKDILEGH